MLDGVEFGNEVVALVRGFVDREIAPLKAENDALKNRLKAVEDRPASTVDLEQVKSLIDGEIAKLPPLSEMPDVSALVGEAVTAAISALPSPEAGQPGEDGASVTLDDVAPLITEAVERAVATLPVAQDGKDAAGIVEALKDNGELVLTLQDGRLIRTGIRDGEPGQRGNDGLGFDDMDACVLGDDRTIELSFRRGTDEKVFTFKWPTIIDRGVYKAGEEYDAGDAVTWGGSLWVAQRATSEKPDTPESGFRLAVKRGRDGKDAK